LENDYKKEVTSGFPRTGKQSEGPLLFESSKWDRNWRSLSPALLVCAELNHISPGRDRDGTQIGDSKWPHILVYDSVYLNLK
jgi:hypothetical protein